MDPLVRDEVYMLTDDKESKSAIIVVFPKNVHVKFIEYFTQKLKDGNLLITYRKCVKGSQVVQVKTTKSSLLKAATQNGLVKTNLSGELEQLTEGNFNNFPDCASDKFFSHSEDAFLLHTLLTDIKTDDIFNDFIPKSRHKVNPDDELVSSCLRMNLLHETFLEHNETATTIWNKFVFALPFNKDLATNVNDYYGSQIALYFDWMRHFTVWLILPGLLGFCIWLHNYLDDDVSMDNSMLAPFFTIFMIFWGVFFIKYWSRRRNVVTCRWGLLDRSDSDSDIRVRVRPEFRGALRMSPVTGRAERYFPWTRRLARYIVSGLATGVMLLLAFTVMVLSLNLQGYIHSGSVGAAFIHFHTLHRFSHRGALFDPYGEGPLPYLLPYIPTILHSCTIILLNTIYKSIALKLTNMENHKTQSSFDNSLIIKRFLFEAFDCYIALFYLAFLQLDIVLLRLELINLFMVDSIRRLTTESLIPLFKNIFSDKVESRKNAKSKKDDTEVPDDVIIRNQLRLEEYEQFDDFLEMVIEFGYISLFASAFPLASALSVLCNLVEIKSDLFKLTFVARRPFVSRVSQLATWESIISYMVWTSMLTNVFIFGFTTEQMAQLAPDGVFRIDYNVEHLGDSMDHVHAATAGWGRWLVGAVFLIEHCFILVAKVILAAIPDQPGWVTDQLDRREYKYRTAVDRD